MKHSLSVQLAAIAFGCQHYSLATTATGN